MASGAIAYHADEIIPYRYTLKEGDGSSAEPHYVSCIDFTIRAEILDTAVGEEKTWSAKLKVPADCPG